MNFLKPWGSEENEETRLNRHFAKLKNGDAYKKPGLKEKNKRKKEGF